MNKHRIPPQSRSDAWRNATWFALVFAVIVLLVVKLFTPVVFGGALALAVMAFVVGLGLAMRLTPRSGR